MSVVLTRAQDGLRKLVEFFPFAQHRGKGKTKNGGKGSKGKGKGSVCGALHRRWG